MTIQSQIIIDRPLEQVWAFFIARQNWKKWWGQELRLVEPGWRKNATITWENGKSILSEWRPQAIVQFEGAQVVDRFSFEALPERQTRVSLESTYKVEADSPDLTSVAVKNEVVLAELKALVENDRQSFRPLVNAAPQPQGFTSSQTNIKPARITIPLQIQRSPADPRQAVIRVPQIGLPEQCIYCTAPARAFERRKIRVQFEVSEFLADQASKAIPFYTELKYKIPFCRAHAAQRRRFSWMIVLDIWAALTLIVFIALMILTRHDGPWWETILLLIGAGGLSGLIALSVYYLLFHFARRISQRPPWFNITFVKTAGQPPALQFQFNNPAYAEVFSQANQTISYHDHLIELP